MNKNIGKSKCQCYEWLTIAHFNYIDLRVFLTRNSWVSKFRFLSNAFLIETASYGKIPCFNGEILRTLTRRCVRSQYHGLYTTDKTDLELFWMFRHKVSNNLHINISIPKSYKTLLIDQFHEHPFRRNQIVKIIH